MATFVSKPVAKTAHVAFLLDASESMEGEKMTTVLNVQKKCLTKMSMFDNSKTTVQLFDTFVTTVYNRVDINTVVTDVIATATQCHGGGTNLWKSSYELIRKANVEFFDDIMTIIVFTDGNSNDSEMLLELQCLLKIMVWKEFKLVFITVGISDKNKCIIDEMTNDRVLHYNITSGFNIHNINATFGVVAEEVNDFFELAMEMKQKAAKANAAAKKSAKNAKKSAKNAKRLAALLAAEKMAVEKLAIMLATEQLAQEAKKEVQILENKLHAAKMAQKKAQKKA